MSNHLEIEDLFKKQRSFRWETKKWKIEHRKNLLHLLHQSLISHQTEIIEALKEDFQKPEFETLMTEISPVLHELRLTIKKMKTWAKPLKVSSGRMLLGTHCEIQREARGNVLIISPWNYPFQLAMSPLISALAAGNTVILKPSELTPATSAIMAKILSELYEPELVSVIQGGAEVSQKLLQLPFDHIFFTGSTRIGKVVMKAAAENLSSVTLELGGKSPTIVHSSCDLELTAKKLVWGKFLNSGQTCVAPDYIFVEKKIEKALCEALQLEIKAQLNSKIQAQIIHEKNTQRLKELVESSGGQNLTPGDMTESRRLPPTLVLSPALDSNLMQEEIFGPVLPILPYTDLAEVIAHIQSQPKPLALYIFAHNDEVIEKILTETSAGGVCINDTVLHLANASLPFGGVGESGQGRYHGEFSFQTFSHEKAVLKQGALEKMVTLFYPPYTEKKKKRFKFFAGI